MATGFCVGLRLYILVVVRSFANPVVALDPIEFYKALASSSKPAAFVLTESAIKNYNVIHQRRLRSVQQPLSASDSVATFDAFSPQSKSLEITVTLPLSLLVHPWYLERPVSAIVRRAVEHGLLECAERAMANLWRVLGARRDEESMEMEAAGEEAEVGQMESLVFMAVICGVSTVLASIVFVYELLVHRNG